MLILWSWITLTCSVSVLCLLSLPLQAWMCVRRHPVSSSALITLEELSAHVILAIASTEKDTVITNLLTVWVSALPSHLLVKYFWLLHERFLRHFIMLQSCIPYWGPQTYQKRLCKHTKETSLFLSLVIQNSTNMSEVIIQDFLNWKNLLLFCAVK